MKEHKFRAWCPNCKRIFNPFLLEWYKKDAVVPEDWQPCGISEGLFDPDTIFLEYTGIKDENDKEIYEGDIYKWWQPLVQAGKQIYKEHVTPVIFEIPELFYLKNRAENGKGVEIIGNIYEYPELLEGDDNEKKTTKI